MPGISDLLTLDEAAQRLRFSKSKLRKEVAEESRGNGNGNSTGSSEASDNTPGAATSDRERTDFGNGRRLVERHGESLRFCAESSVWFIWNQSRWEESTGSVLALAAATGRSFYADAARIGNRWERTELLAHASYSLSRRGLSNMVWIAQSQPDVQVRFDELDADPMALNVQNGTIDLRTAELRPHRREDLITKLASVDYDLCAECPTFRQFLYRILAENQELIRFVQKLFGYAIRGDVTEKIVAVLYGTGDNGKTTLLEAIRYVLGDYAGQVLIDTVMAQRHEPSAGARSDIADLRGRRFVTSSEAESGVRLAEGQLKYLTGMGTLKAKRMRKDHFEFPPTHTLFVDANHRPVIRGTDDAIWNRICLVPFSVKIPKREQNKHLLDDLKGEASGILAWLVEGCLLWQEEGLERPAEVASATEDYRKEMDVLGGFLDARCGPEPGAKVASGELFSAYRQFAEAQGEKSLTQRAFNEQMAERGFLRKREGGGQFWQDLKFAGEDKSRRVSFSPDDAR